MTKGAYMSGYTVQISSVTRGKLESYLATIKGDQSEMGANLKARLDKNQVDISGLDTQTLFHYLVNTKKHCIFAESAVLLTKAGGQENYTDWSPAEASILGDISINMPVSYFDNGVHSPRDPYFQIHGTPIKGNLCFVPGALLKNAATNICPDLDELKSTETGQLDPVKLSALYERRLLPLLLQINNTAQQNTKRALVTIPGLGCGCFQGTYHYVDILLQVALKDLLEKHGDKLSHIAGIHFDRYEAIRGIEGDQKDTIKNIHLHTRSFRTSPEKAAQLDSLEKYGDNAEYIDCEHFCIVAWDHFSFPGNDFFAQNNRKTDDGVKAAATNSMLQLLPNNHGITGTYDPQDNKFKPTGIHENMDWNTVFAEKNIELNTSNTLVCDLETGSFTNLRTGVVIENPQQAQRRQPVVGGLSRLITQPSTGGCCAAFTSCWNKVCGRTKEATAGDYEKMGGVQ